MRNKAVLTIYGIKNCDKVRATLKWLDKKGARHRFHDFRADGLDKELLGDWCDILGWQALLNRRSTTWRGLSADDQRVASQGQAIDLLARYPTLIRRPVIQSDGFIEIGFTPAIQERLEAVIADNPRTG